MRSRRIAIALASVSAAAMVAIVPSVPAALASAPSCAAAAWTGESTLHVAEAGGEVRTFAAIAPGVTSTPRWDLTGTHLSFVRPHDWGSPDASWDVVVVDRAGTEIAVIADAFATVGFEEYLEAVAPFAPDGRVSWVGDSMLELRTWPAVVATSIALPTTGEAGLAWSPDGARFAWHANAPASQRQVWVADADGIDPHPVGDAAAEITHLRWSDDDSVSWIVDGTGRSIDAATGSAVPALIGPPTWTSPAGTVLDDADLNDVAWSDDDRLVATLDNRRVHYTNIYGQPRMFLLSALSVRTTDERWRTGASPIAPPPGADDIPDIYAINRVVMSPGVATADVRLEVTDVVVDAQRTSMHVVVTNDGPCIAPDVTLPVPELGDVNVVAISNSGPDPIPTTGPGAEGIQLRLGDLASGETRTFELAVDVAAPDTPAAAFISLDSPIADPTPDDAIALIEASPAPLSATFPDVPASSPFTTPIAWAAHHAITGGYPDGGFHPTAPVTRQAIAAMTWRLRGSPQGPFSEPLLPAPFNDVAHDDQFATAIDWARWAELTAGYPDGGYHPTSTITRQSLVAMLWRLAGKPTGAPDPGFPDVPLDHPFHDAIAWATHAGITTGYTDGTFHPGGTVTRQAAAAWLTRWHDTTG